MMTTKQLFNAKNNGQKIEKGMHINVVSVGNFDDTDKDGNAVTVTALMDKNGSIYTTISATIANSVELLSKILDEDGEAEVVVNESTSNGGRKFFMLEVL